MVSNSVPDPLGDKSRQLSAMSPNAAWKSLPLTPDVVQSALTAVGYKTNYARTVSSRFCLHYINSLRSKESSGVVSYLISVDGCESSQVVDGGRCDIYSCKPYTYELTIAQKAAGSSNYGVLSVYKTQDQKSVDEIREEESNVDIFAIPVPQMPPPRATWGPPQMPPSVGEGPPPMAETPVFEIPPSPEGEQPYIVLPPLPEGAVIVPGHPDLSGLSGTPIIQVAAQDNQFAPVPVQDNQLYPAPVPNYPVVVPVEDSVQAGTPMAWQFPGGEEPPNAAEEDAAQLFDDGEPDVPIEDVQWTNEEDPDTPISDEEPLESIVEGELEHPASVDRTMNGAPTFAIGGGEPVARTARGELEFPTEDAKPFVGEPNALTDNEEPVGWTGGVDDNFMQEPLPLTTDVPIIEPMFLRADAAVSSISKPGRITGVDSVFVAGIGVAMVLVAALVVVRLRARAHAASHTSSEEQAPLHCAHVTTEQTATASEGSKAGVDAGNRSNLVN